MINANDPQLKSWLEIPADSDFPIQNIPFGVYKKGDQKPRLCSRIGDFVIDLFKASELGFLTDFDIPKAVFEQPSLNDFIGLGKATTGKVRNRIAELFDAASTRFNSREMVAHLALPIETVEMLLPVRVGDYTDFYSSIEHATNVGKMFRDPENALLPNWRHIPVGYHGRASSIIVSGTPIRRPQGQMIPNDSKQPIFGPCRLLDFELEMAFVIGKENGLGNPIQTGEADDYIFGLSLFNDWSARDIQKWEYVPLGPFLGKSFASTLSPWIITLEALEAFKVDGPVQEPKVLPYLEYEGKGNYDINLEVLIQPEHGDPFVVSRSNFKYMYWNMKQQLTHHTVNGCNVKVGDICASGTISGATPDSYGSMLELTWRGSKPITLPDGSERKFIADGDTVTLRGFGERNGIKIGFGEASGTILPAFVYA